MPDLPVIRSGEELRRAVRLWKREGLSVGLVPTMGALHAGHISLVALAKARCDRVVATIFVNPRQFSPGEDLDAYPRTMERDIALLGEAGCHALFAPTVSEIYPAGFATSITVSGISEGLCGATRPNFFGGIATVVAKLLILAEPDTAFFGEKDYQQLLVIKRLVKDLALPVEIIGGALIREPDGLAMSSRNAYLSDNERQMALTLYHTLKEMTAGLEAGADPARLIAMGLERLAQAGFRMDYLELRDTETLEPIDRLERPARLLAGGYLGQTRLIDNMPVTPKDQG
jgi:pantoate--beta-alanine ligase